MYRKIQKVPTTGLLSDGYAAERSALIDPDDRQDNVEAGDPWPYNSDGSKGKPNSAKQADEEGRNTTHFSIVDRDGNIVTWTSTIESGWGTGLMVPGWGFMLNNELTDFNSTPQYNPDPNNFNSVPQTSAELGVWFRCVAMKSPTKWLSGQTVKIHVTRPKLRMD